MKSTKPIDTDLLISLFNKKHSISLIASTMGISRYRIDREIGKLGLGNRDKIIVKESQPAQEWTDDRKKAFMSAYREKGIAGVVTTFNVSRDYAPVLAMRFRRAGF